MNIFFLGTGPAGGNLQETGKTQRTESSIFVKSRQANILIDVTQFFTSQSAQVDRIDAVLVTHGHKDACGGVPGLDSWLEKRNARVSLFTHGETIEKIRDFSLPKRIEFVAVEPFHSIQFADIRVTALPVDHSIQPGFPTFGFFLENEKNSLAYVSDVSRWPPETEPYLRKADILIVDGSMWHTRMPSHITLDEVLPVLCGWENKRIIVTHVGKAAGKHEVYAREIRRMCDKASVAFDGMKVGLM